MSTVGHVGGFGFRYNGYMERIIDKLILLVCCSAGMVIFPFSTVSLVAGLLAVTTSALHETGFVPQKVRNAISVGYVAAALFVPEFVLFIPLVAYDCFAIGNLFLKVCWIIPGILALRVFDPWVFFIIGVSLVIAAVLAWRTGRVIKERTEFLNMRDELREASLSLETKNRSLREKQDYEVRLATLSERGRIAREIHDNVGHLLTRSVLQIEALQVVHADDCRVKSELEQVGETVHRALETVRESVHNLHDDAFDLHTQLFAVQKQTTALTVDIRYTCEEVPPSIGYAFIAIVREGVSNAVRHSDATQVKVSVVEYPAFWQLIVHDNGTSAPFNKSTDTSSLPYPENVSPTIEKLVKQSGGIGLRAMEERVRSLDGILRIEYERGMRVFASIPKHVFEERKRT